MPNHFSTLGMQVASQDQMFDLIERAADLAQEIPVAAGSYLLWAEMHPATDASGAAAKIGPQLWIQLDRERNLVGVTPYFSGLSRMALEITHTIVNEGDTELEAACHA